MQIAICDDQNSELEHTYSMVQTYSSLHPELNISLHKFMSGCELLESISGQNHFDIYLLDILMPETNGIEMGAAIRKKDSFTTIIYLTSSPDYALQSYQVDAGGYLLKPLDEKDLFTTLDKAFAKLDAEEQKCLILKTSRDSIESIYYRKSFRELTISLTDSRFVKVNVATIVNMQHIRNINSREVRLSNEEKLVISRQYTTIARKTFMDYLLERGNEI